ncbi:hypothetical protein AGOR_G00244130 [Albula goreensis]|uniref:Occludin-like n=1 Tax=Albula goreensis TaxID=1534307 RepID=A0A8T3CKT1_9TELE|nr:hypothetical protein AGOR_G00244130 [Albula goreensis]
MTTHRSTVPAPLMPPIEAIPPSCTPRGDLEGRPQEFYQCLAPTGVVRVLQGLIAVLSFIIFTCAAAALVWDMQPSSVGGYGSAVGGYSFSDGLETGYSSSYPTPRSAKAVMLTVAVLNFLAASLFLAGSFRRTAATCGCKFYLAVLLVDVAMVILQGIANVVFVLGVNPMTQGSMSQNHLLLMCQSLDGKNVWEGAGGVWGFPMFTQYLFHYCYMDAQEIVAMVCGFMVVIPLAATVYFSHKTRSKIWRHGKHNIYWDPPLVEPPAGLKDWPNRWEGGRSIHSTSTLPMTEKPSSLVRATNSIIFYPVATDTVFSEGTAPGYVSSSECSVGGCTEKPSPDRGIQPSPTVRGGEGRQDLSLGRERPQREPGYTTGRVMPQKHHLEDLMSLYPEITSDDQRREYRSVFDSGLALYKRLCTEMDAVTSQVRKLSKDLDKLPEGSTQHQAAAAEYIRLKQWRRTPEYQTKKLQCRELQQKLNHIKTLVRIYDANSISLL